MSQEDDPDWDSFRSYNGPVKPSSRIPRWLRRTFHYFMILFCLALVFCIGGFMFFFYSFDQSRAMDETLAESYRRFIIGGLLAVGAVIYWRFKKLQ